VFIGDAVSGRIFVYDQTVYSDDSEPQKWLRSWRALPPNQNNLKRTAHHSLQLDCETGVGLGGLAVPDQLLAAETLALLLTEDELHTLLIAPGSGTPVGVDPLVMLRWSDDGGHTWSNEHWRSMGRVGQYSYRTLWRRLGMSVKLRDRVYEISGTDPVKIAIMGAELHLSPTNA
jgi:hypothetical protein